MKEFFLILASLIFVMSSVFVIQKSEPDNFFDNNVVFGYPFGFIKQNFDDYDSDKYYQSFSLRRESANTQLMFGRFTLSLIITFSILEVLIYFFEIAYLKLRNILSKLINKK
jgi:hypothetical protein